MTTKEPIWSGKTVTPPPEILPLINYLWDAVNQGEKSSDCRFCKHGKQAHVFLVYGANAIACERCARERETKQVICYSEKPQFEVPEFAVKTVSRESMAPVWFYTDGYAFRVDGSGRIEVDEPNPYDAFSEEWAGYNLFATGISVDDYLRAGGEWTTLVREVEMKRIALVGPDVTAGKMPPSKWRAFHKRWVAAGLDPNMEPPASAWSRR